MNQSGLRCLAVLAILLAFVATASAQFSAQPTISPRLAVYGGYSGYNPGGKSSGIELRRLPHGWNSGAEVHFTPRYSFFADYGSYKNASSGSTQTYLFGPRFTFHARALAPFAEVMMGFQRIGAKNQPTYTAFSEAFGAGLDVAITRGFGLRLFQADFVYAADHEKTQLDLNQFFGARVSAGIVWNLSRRHRPSVVAKTESKTAPTEAAKSEAASATAPSSATVEKEKPAESTTAEVKKEVATPEPTAQPEPTKPAEVSAPPSEPAASPEPTNPVVASAPASVPLATSAVEKEVQSVGTLTFPYEQYPTYLSPQDKRSLDAVASRLKLEPKSTLTIVGASPRWAGPKAAAQRAVNSKDYLIRKGIAAERVKVFARPTAKSKPAKTELMFVPAGQAYTAGSATPVDELHVKPEHLHVTHPEWREK